MKYSFNMNIAIFEVQDWQEKYLRKKLKEHKLMFFEEKISDKHVKNVKNYEIICNFVYSKITEKLLDKLPNLKLICTMSTGFDHIDLEACSERKIVVCNAPTYAEVTVAEHTFSMILALSRKLCNANEKMMKGNMSLDKLRGFDLKNKILGLIGVGHIGLKVIKMAKGFDMNIIAYDIFKKGKLKYVSLDNLLRKSDVISLHCPLTEDNEHLIDKKAISKMKNSSILVNTARGGLVDILAVLDAIKNKKLGGVGLDVLENERDLRKNLLFKRNDKLMKAERFLLKQDNVLITAHNAFNSEESVYRLLDETVENINCFLKKKIKNKVN
jgi:D-lactate dehydrogenase